MTTQDKSYRCGTCNAEFRSQEELDRHTQSAHKVASTESRPGDPERERADREQDRRTGREMPR